jgi:ribonuclease T2
MNQSLLILALLALASADQWRYKLAQEWPGSVCKTNKCTSQFLGSYDGSAWNMHGVWPDKQTASNCVSPFTCTHESYNPKEFGSGTVTQLDRFWVGLYNDVNDFRGHEWTKHGTCWQGPSLFESSSQQESFFRTSLALHQTYNLFDGLRRAGITPSDTKTYPLSSIVNSFKSVLAGGSGGQYVTEAMMEIQCQNDKATGKSMITQVYLCLDSKYLPTNCNCDQSYQGISNGCSSQILYPTFSR